MKHLLPGLALVLAPALVGSAAWAHHSVAAYDFTRKVTLVGTVRSFQWGNPHSYIQLDVIGADRKMQTWSIEAGVPAGMIRNGWTPRSLKAGDKVTVAISPKRDGTPNGTVRSITLPNGTVLAGGAAATEGTNAPSPADLLPSVPRAAPRQPR